MHMGGVILRVGELYCHTPAKSWVGFIIGFDPELDIGFKLTWRFNGMVCWAYFLR